MLIDTFKFNGEWDMLALRLRTLDKLVDRFVLVECDRTFRGKPKAFAFDNPPDEFVPWLPRIRYVRVTDIRMPPGKVGRAIDLRQRDCTMRGLDDAADDDVVILSDLDEIPNPATYGAVLDALEEHPMVSLKMEGYTFWLNMHRGPWSSVISAKASTLRASHKGLGQIFANHCRGRGIHTVNKDGSGGWHFSWMGPWSRIQAKQRAMVEEQWDTPEFRESLRADFENDRYGFKEAFPLTLQPIDHTFPLPLQENPERWAHIIKDAKGQVDD